MRKSFGLFLGILLYFVLFTGNIQAQNNIRTYYHPDEDNNNNVYNNAVGSQFLYLIVHYPSSPGGSTTLSVNPDPAGLGNQVFKDTDNDGYFAADGCEGQGPDKTPLEITPSQFTEGTYTITSSKGGSIQVKIDQTRPTISNLTITNLTRGGSAIFTQNDSLQITANITDGPGSGNLLQTGIVANLYNLTNNPGHVNKNPDSWSGGLAKWTVTAGNVGDGNKGITIIATDLAPNERQATGTIKADNTPPGVVTVIEPANNAHVLTRTPTFSWYDLDAGAGTDEVAYNLQIDTNNNFSNPVVNDTINNSDPAGNKYNHTISTQLIYGKTYYWRIRAKDGVGQFGEFSSFRTLYVDIPAAPTITSTIPTSNATNVSIDANVVINFSDIMDKISAQNAFSLIKYPGGSPLSGAFSWENGDKRMIFDPSAYFEGGSSYKLAVSEAAKNNQGIALQVPYSIVFTTETVGVTVKGKISPRVVLPSTVNLFSLLLHPEIDLGAPGIDKITITMPTGHSFDSTGTTISPSGTFITAGNDLIFTLNNTMNHANQQDINIEFSTQAGASSNAPNGVKFQVKTDNSGGTNPISASPQAEGDLTVVTQSIINSAIGEINPSRYRPNITATATFSAKINASFNDAGMNLLKIGVPTGYGLEDSSELWVGLLKYNYATGEPGIGQYSRNISGNTMEIKLGTTVKQDQSFRLDFALKTPLNPDASTGGAKILYQMGNSAFTKWYPLVAASCVAGNANDEANDSNALMVATGFPCASAIGEINPNEVPANATNQLFTLRLRPSFNVHNNGVDKFIINFPEGYQPKSLEALTIRDGDNQSASFTVQYKENSLYPPSGGAYWYSQEAQMVVVLSVPINSATWSGMPYPNIRFEIKGDTPGFGGAGEMQIACDSKFPQGSSSMNVNPGDANGSGDGSLEIVTKAPAFSALGEMVPAFVKPIGIESFSLWLDLDFDLTNSGVDRIYINTTPFSPSAFNQVLVNGSDDSSWTGTITATGINLSCPAPLLDSCIMEIRFLLTKPNNPGGPHLFDIKVDNSQVSNPQTVIAGSVDPVSGNSETLSLKCGYPVTAGRLFSELALHPLAEPSIINSVGAETDFTLYFGWKPLFNQYDFGLNRLILHIPEPFTDINISGAELTVDGAFQNIVTSVPQAGEARIIHSAGPGNSGTVSVELGTTLNSNKPVILKIGAKSPVVFGGQDQVTTIPAWGDFSWAENKVASIDQEVSNALNGANHSMKINTILMPASGLNLTLIPTEINIGESISLTVKGTPVFKPSDTGLDKITMILSPNILIDPQTITVKVSGINQTNPSILRGLVGASYEVRISNIDRLSPASPGDIEVNMTVVAPLYPERKGIYMVGDDSLDGKNRFVYSPGVAFRVKGPAEKAVANINPRALSYSELRPVDIAIEMFFTGDESGVDKIDCALPQGFVFSGDISGVQLFLNGAPLSQSGDYSAQMEGADLKILLANKISTDSSLMIQTLVLAPSYTQEGPVKIKLSHQGNANIIMECKESTPGDLIIGSTKIGINSSACILETHGSAEPSKWKVTGTVPFNSKMNTSFGTMKLNGFFKGVKTGFGHEGDISVWKGYFLVPFEAMEGMTNEVTLVFEEGRDINGAKVGTIIQEGIYLAGGSFVKASYLPLMAYSPTAYNIRLGIFAYASRDNMASITGTLRKSTVDSSTINLVPINIERARWGTVDLARDTDGSYEISIITVDNKGRTITEKAYINSFVISGNPGIIYAPDRDFVAHIPKGINQSFLLWNDIGDLISDPEKMYNEAQSGPKRAKSGQDYIPSIGNNGEYSLDMANEELVYMGNSWQIAPHHKFQSPMIIEISDKEGKNSQEDEKVGLYKKEASGWAFMGAKSDGIIRVLSDETGKFALFKDILAPRITEPEIKKGKIIIAFEEKGSGINMDKIKVLWENRPVEPDIDTENNQISLAISSSTTGDRELSVEIWDNAGNSVIFNGPVYVPYGTLLDKISVYPSPAAEEVTFSFDSDASRIRLTIYDSSGELVFRYWGTGLGKKTEIIWDLVGQRGKAVANGVYFWQIQAFEDGQSARKKGKFGVLR